MKQLFSLFAVLLLVGAGCAATPAPETDIDAMEDITMDQTVEGEDADDMEVELESDADDDASMEAEDLEGETETVTIDAGDGVEVEIEVESSDTEPVQITLGGNTQEISMETGNFFFSPSTITASAGEKVAVTFTANSGTHDFVIDELGVSYDIEEGGRVVFTAPSEPGSYAFYCSIGSHRAMGMEGVLIVE